MADGVKYFVNAILDVKVSPDAAIRKLHHVSRYVNNMGKSMQRMGPSITSSLFSMRNGLLALGAAAAFGGMIKSAIDANREIENLEHGVATTLQLLQKNKYIRGMNGEIIGVRNSTEMMTENLNEAAYATDRLFRIAATSPTTFKNAAQMYRNMMPGLAQVEGSQDKILEFTKKSLSVGVLLQGDYAQAGRDMRRIVTGQAGMEVRAWTEGIKDATKTVVGQNESKYKSLYDVLGDDDKFVKTFNKLGKGQRYELIQETIKDMGAATEAAALTWDGLTSAISSEWFLIKKAFGQPLFDGMKPQLQALVGRGGLLDPDGDGFKKLERAARVAGHFVAQGGAKVFDWILRGVTYFSDNWQKIYVKMAYATDKAIKLVKGLIGLSVARRTAQYTAGTGVRALGGAAMFVQQGMLTVQILTALGLSLGGIATASLIILPIIALLGAGLIGLSLALGGVAVWFLSHWDEFLTGIRNGSVHLNPLIQAFGDLWAKFLAVGEVIMGTKGAKNATASLNTVILQATNAMYGMMGAASAFLRTAGGVALVWNALQSGIAALALGFVYMVKAITDSVVWAGKKLGHDMEKDVAASERMDMLISEMKAGIRDDAADVKKWFTMADEWDAASDTGKQWSQKILDGLAKSIDKDNKGGSGDDNNTTDNGKITIHNMQVYQDLRNHDPDRIMGAFIRKLERTTHMPTQAVTHEDYGV